MFPLGITKVVKACVKHKVLSDEMTAIILAHPLRRFRHKPEKTLLSEVGINHFCVDPKVSRSRFVKKIV